MPTSAARGHAARQVMQSWVTDGKRTESAQKAPRPSVDVANISQEMGRAGDLGCHDDDWERGLSDVLDLRTSGRSGARGGHRNTGHRDASKRRSVDTAEKGRAGRGSLHDDFLRAELSGEGYQ